jgi:hypothetical protein
LETSNIGHVCTCTEHHQLTAASEDFWHSPKGILHSIDGLSQDLHFTVVNNALKMVASVNGVKWLFWRISEADNVCWLCLEKATGGDGGFYRVGWFMPKMPVHPNCRCQWELVFEK